VWIPPCDFIYLHISMKNTVSLLLTLLILSGCSSEVFHTPLRLEKDSNYPKWLASGSISADQTSGIAFIKEARDGSKYFLLADDSGRILHFVIAKDTIFTLKAVEFSENCLAYLDTFPKPDFEEIIYDNKKNEVFVSIEGDGMHPERYAGIYRLIFKENDVLSDTIEEIRKIEITPEKEFQKYLADNIGYEGVALDDNYFYLGLEGFTKHRIFADSTVLFIVKRETGEIIRQINTRHAGIHTICGLYSDQNYSVYGVDRNNKSLFHLSFDDNLNIIDTSRTKIKTSIPNYSSFDYVASIESVTMDPEGNIYLVDDPWKMFFIPSIEILNQIDSLTVNRFRNFIPIIYKFSTYK
jgi:hypothetical protein